MAISRWRRFLGHYLKGLVGSGYLFTVGVIEPRNRQLITTISRHFERQPRRRPAGERPKPSLPNRPVTELFDGRVPISLLEVEHQDGNVSVLELATITTVVRRQRPRRIFEIGTFDGRTTLNMVANAPEDGHLFTLDLPPAKQPDVRLELDENDLKYIRKPESGRRLRDHPLADRVTQLFGDSASFDFSPYHGTIDLVFVDGSHSYDYVLNDSRVASDLIGDRGTIIWHDYDTPWWAGVTRALNELHEAGGPFGGLRRITGTSLVYLERG